MVVVVVDVDVVVAGFVETAVADPDLVGNQ